MQVILSEIDCLDVLNAKGVYPDEFYTDFEIFKNNMPFFREATVIVIFAGNCRFNKKLTLEVVKSLMKRASSDTDNGIKAVYVVSDITIAGLNSYYKYEGSINTVSVMRGWKEVLKDTNIWKKLASPKKESVKYLSRFDSGDISEPLKRYQERERAEDEYKKLIKVPNLRELLGLS